jgi:molybdopterin synthase sulfur carrier subunit
MATVWIPSLLRDLTNGQDTVRVPGATVGQIIEALERAYPGMKARLCDGSVLRRGLTVAVDTQVARLGLAQPVSDESEVHFIPAISGGS